MFYYTDNDDLEDWGICDQSSEYPKYFSTYTQAMMELDKDPSLAVEEVRGLDERTGTFTVTYIVTYKSDTDRLYEKY